MTKTRVEMMRRHVVEGAERVAKQQRLVALLERCERQRMLPVACELLNQFRVLQQMSEKRLARELGRGD